MTRLLGYNALMVALAVAAFGVVAVPIGIRRSRESLIHATYSATYAVFALVSVATFAMIFALVTHDFSVGYVAQVGSRATPLFYTIISLWGALEGSILFWAWVLALLSALVVFWNRDREGALIPYTTMVMLATSVFFLILLVGPANPFTPVSPVPPDGPGPNPLLQNHILMGVHPPLLYLGYVGLTVPFAFAVGAMAAGEVASDDWIRLSRRWTLGAWAFLTAAIIAGMWWSYEVLGWGGYWAWDPVENASFMPWLTATAFLHSVMVQERRGMLKLWNLNLIVTTFALTILGTFLTRSGVLSSVHAFATDPERGIFILGFLVAVVGGSLLLFAWRGPKVGVGGMFEPVSREGMLLANNVLLMVATAAVMLGTLYPLVLDAFGLGKISVGPAYFNAVFVPLMAPALFLMGVGPIAKWKKASLPELAVRLRWAAAVSLVAAVVAPFAFGRFTPLVGFGLFLAFWILATSAYTLFQRVQGQPLALWWPRLKTQTGSWYGMLLAHAGVGVFVIGVTLVGGYETEQDLKMEVGSSANAGGYAFKLVGLQAVQGPNYDAVRATFELTRDGRLVKTVYPEKRSYHRSSMPMTEVALERGFTRDLYVSLGEPLDGGKAWAVRIYVKPFVNWIWGGCVLMSLGGLLAVADRRYRLKTRAAQALPRGAAAA